MPELSDRELVFVRAIAAAPGDLLPRQAYADYLDDLGDPRGEYLRLTVRYATEYLHYDDRAATVARLRELTDAIDPAWRAAFDPGPRAFKVHRKHSPPVVFPLDVVPWSESWVFAEAPPKPFAAYVYSTAVNAVNFVVHARMRYVRTVDRGRESFAFGTEGTNGPPRPFPLEWLADMHYRIPHKPRWLKQRVSSRSVHDPGRFSAVNLVDAATAFRFDCLINGWV